MGESVWVLGASMTKISRYPDKDVIDLAAEVTFNALDDAGVTIFDMEVLAAGSMFNMGGIGQAVAKQVGQTGIPIYNVVNACATGATAVRTAYLEIAAGGSKPRARQHPPTEWVEGARPRLAGAGGAAKTKDPG